MTEIDKIHDKFFKDTFSVEENTRDFLELYLPEKVKDVLDLNSIEYDKESYVIPEMKEYYTDLLVKTRLKNSRTEPVDIYILYEHKSYLPDKQELFLQLLNYKYLVWRHDHVNKKPLRLIIPLVFYHHKRTWEIPYEFKDLFNVPENLNDYILNFKYILFDTNNWDIDSELSKITTKNVFLLTSIFLLKAAYDDNIELIEKIFDFWVKNGFIDSKNKSIIIFFMLYISKTKEIEKEELEEILHRSKMKEGDFMPTLAERMKEEMRPQLIQEGQEEGLQNALIRQMRIKFNLSTQEEESIRSIKNVDKLNKALEEILFAESKTKVLNVLF